MKVKIAVDETDFDGRTEMTVLSWYEYDNGVEVEIPDELVEEWRHIEKRREEIYAWFEEHLRAQLEAKGYGGLG